MDINRLRYFCTITKTGSLRKAAELHRVSPPALSKALRLLEIEAGKKLVVPDGRGIRITDEGRRLAERASKLLDEFERLGREDEASAACSIRVATFEVFSTYFMGWAAREVFDGFEISLLEQIPGQIESSIAEGRADLGLTYLPIPNSDVDHLKVGTVEMGIFGRERTDRFVIPMSPVFGAPTRVQGLDGWPDERFPRKVRYRVTLMESALEFCRQGLAVGYFPKFVVRLHNERVQPGFRLREWPLPESFPNGSQAVYLVKRKSALENRSVKKLAKAVRSLVK